MYSESFLLDLEGTRAETFAVGDDGERGNNFVAHMLFYVYNVITYDDDDKIGKK